jgi:16S rRNA (cytidine1402-2'-O)-methyltransferase
MQGILYVVATPIGNLEDVSFRAVRVLREVSLIAAEDTRRTARLLQHYSITTPTTSLHEHNERSRVPGLLQRLKDGQDIAVVSDAGTPVVSDPGALLISAAHTAGIRVVPIPGPNAAIAALSASGISAGEFVFAGFPPARSTDRIKWLTRFAGEARPVIFFEAPHRIYGLLTNIKEVFPSQMLTIARELTKAHEILVMSPINALSPAEVPARGEFTLVLHPSDVVTPTVSDLPGDDALRAELGELTNTGLGTRQAVDRLARKYGTGANALYRRLIASKR